MTIYGVYMPHNDNTRDSLDLYVDTLDKLQCMLENSNQESPIYVIGDMNTVLPQTKVLPRNWFFKRLFSRRSALMYNFLVENNLCVANFRDKQEGNYTYRKGSVVSYIDHVFIPEYTVSAMNKCVIRHNDANNVSDHLALCMNMELIPQSDNADKTDCNINPVPYLPRLNWQDTNYQRRYCELLKESLDQISRSTYDLSEINKGSAVVFVNNLYNVICSTIHDVTKKCANEFNERKTHGAKRWTKGVYTGP